MSARVPTVHQVTDTDRLGITVFLAVAFHAIVILGITFDYTKLKSDKEKNPPRLDVTIVNTLTEEKPDQADYLAQSNQVGAGNTEEKLRPQAPPDAAPQVVPTPGNSDSMSPPDVMQIQEAKPIIDKEVLTADRSKDKLNVTPETPQEEATVSKAAEMVRQSLEMAKLDWELGELKKLHAKKVEKEPKLLVPNSTSAVEAAYLDTWQKKVEAIGTLNYPEEAKRRNISGSLLLLVTVNADGSLLDVQVTRSSGKKVLDDAAKRIIKMSSPFPPFPDDMRKQYPSIQIPRVWKFINGNTTLEQG